VTSDWRTFSCHPRIAAVNALHPLGQLIQSVEDSKGWTMREIARRAERAQVPLSNAYLGKLKRQGIRSITIETIHALAVGLDLPERIVATAALETMGVHDIGSAESRAAVAIARDPELSERDRRILLAVVREMQGEQDEEQRAGSAASGSDSMEDPPQPDGVTPRAGGRRLTRADFDRAADDSGPSLLEADDARAAARGEESQDTGSDEPA
jgi:transcriptional regulator with XRE-family HTH domain